MVLNEISPGRQYLPINQQNNEMKGIELPGGGKFSDTFKEFISDVNSFQQESNSLEEKMIKGEPVDIHDAMIAAEKAKTTFQLLSEIRNKFLDMYQVVSRMQV
jgi:flagellar hook-basal body complex protein FliE